MLTLARNLLLAVRARRSRSRCCARAVRRPRCRVLDGEIRALALAGDRVAAIRRDQVRGVPRVGRDARARSTTSTDQRRSRQRSTGPSADEVLDLAGIPDDDLESDVAEEALEDEGTARSARRRAATGRSPTRSRAAGAVTDARARRACSPRAIIASGSAAPRGWRSAGRARHARAAPARAGRRSAAPAAVGARGRARRSRPGGAGRQSPAPLQRRRRVLVAARGAGGAPARDRDLGRRTRRLLARRRRRRDRRASTAHADLRRPGLSPGPLRRRAADPRRRRHLRLAIRSRRSSRAARAFPRDAWPARAAAPDLVLALGSDLAGLLRRRADLAQRATTCRRRPSTAWRSAPTASGSEPRAASSSCRSPGAARPTRRGRTIRRAMTNAARRSGPPSRTRRTLPPAFLPRASALGRPAAARVAGGRRQRHAPGRRPPGGLGAADVSARPRAHARRAGGRAGRGPAAPARRAERRAGAPGARRAPETRRRPRCCAPSRRAWKRIR